MNIKLNHKWFRCLIMGILTVVIGGCASPQTQSKRDMMRQGGIQTGWTSSEVRASWGQPKNIQRPGNSDADETWFYALGYILDFKGGILVREHMPGGAVYGK